MTIHHNRVAIGDRAIPHFTFRELLNPNRQITRRLLDALVNPGFIAVLGLEDQRALVEENKRLLREYMTLPESVLAKYTTTTSQRGFVPLGRETAKGETVADNKVFTMTVNEVAPTNPFDRPFGENIWPDELSAYRKSHLALLDLQHMDAMVVLRAFERALDVTPNAIADGVPGAESIQRAIYTPGIMNATLGENISAAHDDINLVTALWPEPGLEVFLPDASGIYQWFTAGIEPGAKVYNTGEMLAHYGVVRRFVELVPTRHRVVSYGTGDDRITFPYFLHARHSEILRRGPYVRNGHVYENLRYGPLFAIRMVELGAWRLEDPETYNNLYSCGLLEYLPEKHRG